MAVRHSFAGILEPHDNWVVVGAQLGSGMNGLWGKRGAAYIFFQIVQPSK